ncbi:YkgJ family cysteine cluster protein [Candidatus Woesearchaeota archaeon]|nr:YkgJ family cysteine cluster protein [Candidatus Woesearchaeota archaeon]
MIPIVEEIPKFSCSACGKCCSHIRGMISDEEKDFLRKFAFGKLPLVQVIPIDKMSFPLFDFEAKRFREWAKEAAVDAKIQPSRVVLDLNSNKAIIVTYAMDYDACPFLKEGKCSIYYTKRAFICRMFPFNRGPFLKTGENPKKEDLFGSCCRMEPILPRLDDSSKDALVQQLYHSLSSEFLNVVQFDFMHEWINKTIVGLMKTRILRPAVNYPYEFLLKRIENSEKIDLMDFLVEAGVKARGEVDALIQKFDENIDAKEFLR